MVLSDLPLVSAPDAVPRRAWAVAGFAALDVVERLAAFPGGLAALGVVEPLAGFPGELAVPGVAGPDELVAPGTAVRVAVLHELPEADVAELPAWVLEWVPAES
jgi:hypothetical protein